MQIGSPLGIMARCKMVSVGVSMERSPPERANRYMSMAEPDAQFRKLPLNALVHLRLSAWCENFRGAIIVRVATLCIVVSQILCASIIGSIVPPSGYIIFSPHGRMLHGQRQRHGRLVHRHLRKQGYGR